MFKADLHIHSVLSPCASLDMSPKNIVKKALEAKLDIIAITDHNSTKNIEVTQNIAKGQNLWVIPGVEVNTMEEIHVLAYFPEMTSAKVFQKFIDDNIYKVTNNNDKFGHQLVVDEEENILEEIGHLLIASLSSPIEQIIDKIIELGGIAVPSHINRPSYSIISQLGMIPENLNIHCVEQSFPVEKELCDQYPQYTTILNSDAHTLENIGSHCSSFNIEKAVFEEIKMAIKNEKGREVLL